VEDAVAPQHFVSIKRDLHKGSIEHGLRWKNCHDGKVSRWSTAFCMQAAPEEGARWRRLAKFKIQAYERPMDAIKRQLGRGKGPLPAQ